MTSTFQYGSPGDRPRCWGDERVRDPYSRECRSCPFTNSCDEQIIRTRNARTLAANTVAAPQQQNGYGQAYFANFAPPQAANPLPIVQPSPVQPPRVAPIQNPVPMQAPQVPQPRYVYPPLPPAPQADRYGWMQDPLYLHIAACPPPPRPQYQGEHFVERMGKNILLDMVESFFKQCLLGVRQVVLPPAQSQDMQNPRGDDGSSR